VVLVASDIGLGKLVRVGLAEKGELGDEIVAEDREQLRLQAIIGQFFHVDVMVGEAAILERKVGRVAPASSKPPTEGGDLLRFDTERRCQRSPQLVIHCRWSV
jgi:hypothetical protein